MAPLYFFVEGERLVINKILKSVIASVAIIYVSRELRAWAKK